MITDDKCRKYLEVRCCREGFTLLLVLAISLLTVSAATSQELDWARQEGGSSSEVGAGIAADDNGNVYVVGQFWDKVTFGEGEGNATTLTSSGSYDIFVACYDSSNALLWVQQAGGSGSDYGDRVAVDGNGNIYVVGRFSGTATFGYGQTYQTTLTTKVAYPNWQYQDIYVAKYDSNGSLLWARRDGDIDSEDPKGIAVDGNGNIYVVGRFRRITTFGESEVNETTLDSFGGCGQDIFVASYNNNGGFRWIQQAGGPPDACPSYGSTGDDFGEGVAIDKDGNCYVTGHFTSSTARFGVGQINELELTLSGSQDVFVAVFNSDGGLLWTRGVESPYAPYPYRYRVFSYGIAVDGDGNSYIAGYFDNSATFAPGESNETILTTCAYCIEIFVAAYDNSGHLLWARQDGSSRLESRGIAVDEDGNSYVTGAFYEPATFGVGEANETDLANSGNPEIFVASYDNGGQLIYAQQARGPAGVYGNGIDVTGDGTCYVTGQFNGTAIFGAGEANETTLFTYGNYDAFVARYAPPSLQSEIEAVIAQLQALIDENPNSDAADLLENARDRVQEAVNDLNKVPPNNVAAVRNLERAVDELESAIENDYLDAETGIAFMESLAGVARQLALFALNYAVEHGGDQDAIGEAFNYLDEADDLRANGHYKEAVDIYKDTLSKAEDAV